MGGDPTLGAGATLLRVANVDELGKSLAYGDIVLDEQRALVQHATELRQQIDGLRSKAQSDADEARKAHDELSAGQANLERQRDGVVEAQALVQHNVQDKVALLSEAAQRSLQIEQGYGRLDTVRDSITNLLADREAGQTPPADTRGIFLSPVPHPRVNQPFGATSDPVLGVSRGHPGIDLAGQMGDPIRAPADGVVVAAGWVDGYGNCTVIDHGNTLGTLYGHQSLIAVKEGDKVTRGQIIGFIGSTGYSTGPHLHWEVRKLGIVTDPAPFIGDTD
jgi:murein DD-endopeptidase MepM/ murein hydrolase activator NlpD